MTTSIFVNGQEIFTPSAQTQLDVSALDVPSATANGIVAVIGTAIGGRPYSAIRDVANDFQIARSSGAVKKLMRDGNIRELGAVMFRPSDDPAIPTGVQQLVFVKANPATQSTLTLVNGDGNCLTITSKDYGQFTSAIKVTVSDTDGDPNAGKEITVVFENTTEIHKNLGQTGKATLIYAGGSDGATTATVTINSTSFAANFTRADVGQDGSFTQAPGASSLEVLSSNNADNTQTVTFFGLDASNNPQKVTVTLNGTTPVAITGTWNLETALTMSATALGTVTWRIAAAGATVATLAPAQTNKGFIALDIPASGTLAVVASGASTRKVVLRGTNAAGQPLAEVLTLNGTTPVNYTGAFTHISSREVGNVEAARTVTLSGKMINAPFASFATVARLKDFVESTSSDFTFTSLIANPQAFNVSDLDHITASSCLTPTTLTLFAKLFDISQELTLRSTLVNAAVVSPGTGAPSNIGPVFLSGGHEGDAGNPGVPTATFGDYQAAIDLLQQIHVDTLIADTSSSAVHAAMDAHCAVMGGSGRDERDFVAAAAVDETKAQIKTRILGLNSRHARLCAQEVNLFNIAGEAVWQPPTFQAALVAAGQAGTALGEPLTKKSFKVAGVRQNSTAGTGWNPTEDSEELCKAGLVFFRFENGNHILVRNTTTYRVDNNVVFSEASANQALNFAVRNFRNTLEKAIGKSGTRRSVTGAKGLATKILDDMVKDESQPLVAYKDLSMTLVKDALVTEVGMAPKVPINFAPATVHVFTQDITA